MNNYFAGDAGVAGATGVAGAGLAVAGPAGSIIFESDVFPSKLKLDKRIKTIKTVAKVHVLLSKKSVVF